eukprot:5239649-Prymnesium_polylepis.1
MRCSAPGVFCLSGSQPSVRPRRGIGALSAGALQALAVSSARNACVPIVCSLACAGRGRCAGCCHPGALRRRVCCGPHFSRSRLALA